MPGDLNRIILQGIHPFLKTDVCRMRVRRYFFIRHSSGGAHLRLRCYGLKADLEHIVAPTLERLFTDHFQRTSARSAAIRYVPYVPEVARFGGPDGLSLAEEHFQFSSELSVRILEVTDGASARCEAYCLALMQSALDELGLTGAVRAAFCDVYAARALLSRNIGQSQSVGGSVPVPVARALVGADGCEPNLLGEWAIGLRSDIARLRAIETRLSRSVMAIIASFVHLLNNRLGVDLIREAQAATLLGAAAREHWGNRSDRRHALIRPPFPEGI